MIGAFEAFAALRKEVEQIPAFSLNAESRRRLLERLRVLDDAMVSAVRTEQYRSTFPDPRDTMTHVLELFGCSPKTGERNS